MSFFHYFEGFQKMMKIMNKQHNIVHGMKSYENHEKEKTAIVHGFVRPWYVVFHDFEDFQKMIPYIKDSF